MSERQMIEDGSIADPFAMAAMQDLSYIQRDAQTLPSASGRDVVVERRQLDVETYGGPTPAQAPAGPVTPVGPSRGSAVRWTPYRWLRERWHPDAVLGAELPAPALAALRRELEDMLRRDPTDTYLTAMASALIKSEQVAR